MSKLNYSLKMPIRLTISKYRPVYGGPEVTFAPLKSIVTERLNSGLITPFSAPPASQIAFSPARRILLNYISMISLHQGVFTAFNRIIWDNIIPSVLPSEMNVYQTDKN